MSERGETDEIRKALLERGISRVRIRQLWCRGRQYDIWLPRPEGHSACTGTTCAGCEEYREHMERVIGSVRDANGHKYRVWVRFWRE